MLFVRRLNEAEKELREAEEENKILRKKVLDLQGELGSSYAKIKERAGIIYAEKIKKNSWLEVAVALRFVFLTTGKELMSVLEGITYGDRSDSRRIISHIKNGKSTIYHCQSTNTYWRTLKAAKVLGPEKKQIKNPRCKDG